MSVRPTPLAAALEGARTTTADLGVEVAGDYGDAAAEYRALREAAALVDRSGRGTVAVRGPDAPSFLQSLVSQDLDPLGDGEGCRSLLLQPQGKLVADFRALRVEAAEWLLDAEVGAGATLAAALARYRIRVQVDVLDTSGDRGVLSVAGPAAAAAVATALGVEVPEPDHAHRPWRDSRVVRVDEPWPGADVVGPRADLDRAWRQLREAGVGPAGLAAAEAARIEAAVPRLGLDMDDATIPQEAFLERTAVSFTKGCFVGQELVCRIDTRGHVNRFLRLLRVDGETPPPGAELIAGELTVGELTSVARHPGGGAVALGLLRREVEPPADVTVRWASGTAAARVVSDARPVAG